MTKYRAWSKISQQMKTISALEFVNGELEYICFGREEGGWYPSQVILMQSTGLFDKNGVAIFEGDVLQRSLPFGEIISGTVEFTKGMFLVDGLECIFEDYIVIGNLYENPDLVS